MAEILVNAVSFTNSDPVKDRRGCFKRGHPGVVFPDGHTWGAEEGLPKFIIVKVPGSTVAEVRAYISEWRRVLNFNIDSQSLPADSFVVTVSADASGVGASGEGRITRVMVENFLTNWNAVVTVASVNSVTFTTVIREAIASDGFWERNISAATFLETNYTQAGGIHRTQVDYPSSISAGTVEELIKGRRGSIISHNTGTRRITFNIARVDVRREFEDSVKRKLDTGLVPRRWILPESFLSGAVDGIIMTTKAALDAAIHDQLTD